MKVDKNKEKTYMKWKKFQKRFREQLHWLDAKQRPKTFGALRRVVPKLPEEATPADLFMFVPGNHSGCVGEIEAHGPFRSFMYLSPALEADTQGEVDFTVAHEFAHVFRRRMGLRLPDDEIDESETDKLAESWGIKKPPKAWGWFG